MSQKITVIQLSQLVYPGSPPLRSASPVHAAAASTQKKRHVWHTTKWQLTQKAWAKKTHTTLKFMVGRLLSFWYGIVSGAMLSFQGVSWNWFFSTSPKRRQILRLDFLWMKSVSILSVPIRHITSKMIIGDGYFHYLQIDANYDLAKKVPRKKESHRKKDVWECDSSFHLIRWVKRIGPMCALSWIQSLLSQSPTTVDGQNPAPSRMMILA